MSQSRQLAAIMFTDIASYTALMGEDEQKAFSILAKNRELQKPIIEKYNGRWIKELGDGVMASFSTVSDAVNAAQEIQEKCNQLNEFSLRIGIHQGEIVIEGDDVFGDAVNIASRIQAIAPIAGIAVSETVHQNIVNKPGVKTRFIKTERLKNVREPVKIFEVVTGTAQTKTSFLIKSTSIQGKYFVIAGIVILLMVVGYFLYSSSKTNEKNISEKSIAVLPFINISNDEQQEYFSDGLTEELMNLLAKTNGLKVIARTSSFAFKGKNEDVKTISEKLGVDHILEGTVRKAGNKIRITAKLIRASDAKMLWNETYNRIIDDIFIVQDEIANAVVKKLRVKLLETGKAKESKPEVLNLILQGNYYHEKLDREGVLKSMQLYKQAVALDSTDARAWAMLAKSYSRAAWQNYIPQQEGYEQARQTVLKGYQIDPDNTHVLLIYAGLKLYYDFEWKGAEELLQRVLELEPANAAALNTLGALYQAAGKWKDAIKVTSEALVYDPLRPIVYINQGANYTYLNQLDKGIEMYRKALEINPQFQRAHMYIGRNYLLQGKPQLALQEMHKENIPFFKHFGLALVMHAVRDQQTADSLLNSFVRDHQKEWPYLIAELYAFRNEKQKAISWLQKAYEQNDSWLVWIKGDPLLKNIWEHPEYISILKKMNLH
jgi:TolB-like protein/class 3 adenylate cyclase/lipoprotein NlpI